MVNKCQLIYGENVIEVTGEYMSENSEFAR